MSNVVGFFWQQTQQENWKSVSFISDFIEINRVDAENLSSYPRRVIYLPRNMFSIQVLFWNSDIHHNASPSALTLIRWQQNKQPQQSNWNFLRKCLKQYSAFVSALLTRVGFIWTHSEVCFTLHCLVIQFLEGLGLHS